MLILSCQNFPFNRDEFLSVGLRCNASTRILLGDGEVNLRWIQKCSCQLLRMGNCISHFKMPFISEVVKPLDLDWYRFSAEGLILNVGVIQCVWYKRVIESDSWQNLLCQSTMFEPYWSGAAIYDSAPRR